MVKMSVMLSKKHKSEESFSEDENKENIEEVEKEREDRALLLTYRNDREKKQVIMSHVKKASGRSMLILWLHRKLSSFVLF